MLRLSINSIGIFISLLVLQTGPSIVFSTDSAAHLDRALEKAKAGDHQGAIREASQAIKGNPDFADAYFARGVSKGALGNYQGAISDYSQAIKIKPYSALAYLNRGQAQGMLGN